MSFLIKIKHHSCKVSHLDERLDCREHSCRDCEHAEEWFEERKVTYGELVQLIDQANVEIII